PRELVPHASDISDVSDFKGERVAVIGCGQSALEYAALLREQGADVRIISRSNAINYLRPRWRGRLFRQLTPGVLRPLSHMIRPPTDLGNFWTARVIAHPERFRSQGSEIQEQLLKSVKIPRGSHWLKPRLKDVETRTGISVIAVTVVGGKVKLRLSDGT